MQGIIVRGVVGFYGAIMQDARVIILIFLLLCHWLKLYLLLRFFVYQFAEVVGGQIKLMEGLMYWYRDMAQIKFSRSS